jgi:hypothetical protein
MPVCERGDRILGAIPRPAECEIAGILPAGTPCSVTEQCAAGIWCQPGLPEGCGVCATRQPDGGICLGDDDCARGFRCIQKHCIPGVGLNAPCDTAPCAPGLTCVEGLCVALLEADGGCSGGAGSCATGLYCSPVRARCEPIQVTDLDGGVPDGGPNCGNLDGGLVVCPAGLGCHLRSSRTQTGSCEPVAGPGEPCPWTGSLDERGACRYPARCVEGVCLIGDRNYCE